MKIAVMQPYLLPYIGYFKLINSVDKFVIFDDVNFIKRGWINRNRILIGANQEYLFTLPLIGASQNVLIKDVQIFEPKKSKEALLKTILTSYKKAQFFPQVSQLIEEIILNPEENLNKYIANSLMKICDYLEIKTDFVFSSELNYDRLGDGPQKIMSIAKILDATSYYNLPGGADLYDKDFFAQNQIELNFIKSPEVSYRQFSQEGFIANLSIVDLLMFNSKEMVRSFL